MRGLCSLPQDLCLAFGCKCALTPRVTITTDEVNLYQGQHKYVNFASASSSLAVSCAYKASTAKVMGAKTNPNSSICCI